MNTQTKILLGVLLIVMLVAGYMFFGGSSATSEPALQTTVPTGVEEETAAGKKFLSILLRLKELHIDRKIFEDPAFVSLQDYGVVLTPEAPGRANPFAPLSQLSLLTTMVGNSSSTPVKTVQPTTASVAAPAKAVKSPASTVISNSNAVPGLQAAPRVRSSAPASASGSNAVPTQAGSGPASSSGSAFPNTGAGNNLTP